MAEIPFPEMPPEGEGYRDKLGMVPWDKFCTVSLFNWLTACRAANLPFVPATEIWRGPVQSLLQYDVEEGEHVKDLRSFSDTVEAARAPNTMFRWDCCAPYEVKGRLGNGQPEWSEDFLYLPIDDPRAFDLLFEYPRLDMAVWQRPWVKAKIVDGYPVEFRSFIKDGEVIGVASYYPQRPLPDIYHLTALEVGALTETLVEHIPAPVWVPHDGGAGHWRQDVVHGTADWLMTEDERLLFLEGGPPFGAGAHPCCFIERDEINGVALSSKLSKDELY